LVTAALADSYYFQNTLKKAFRRTLLADSRTDLTIESNHISDANVYLVVNRLRNDRK
jgi:hypothetical protein